MRYQINCLVSKNDAVTTVIEDDCDAAMFQCRSAQERLRTFITSNVIWIKIRLTAVRHHMSVNHFFRNVAVPRCSLPQFRRL